MDGPVERGSLKNFHFQFMGTPIFIPYVAGVAIKR